MATGLGRGVIAAALLGTLLAGGCTGSTTTPSITPSPSATPTPTPTPSRTYGPNQTAALAAVTGYYTWWNTARKNPRVDARFLELAKYWDLYAPGYGESGGDIAGLATLDYRQVGDMVVADAAPEAENASKITVTVCLDRTGTSLVNSSGETIDPRDRHTGATIPSSQVFTRRLYALVTKPNASGVWVITDLTGGTSSC